MIQTTVELAPPAPLFVCGQSKRTTTRIQNRTHHVLNTETTHTGILRDENLVLRQGFGCNDQKLPCANPRPRPGSPLQGSSIKDILFVSIDVDTGGGYEVISPDQSFHMGLSVFDTRCLACVSFNDPQQYEAILSYHFIPQDTKPCKRAAKHFILSSTELQTLPNIATRIQDLTRDQDYILVAHGTNEDIKFLNNIDPEITVRACYLMDTMKAAQHTLQLSYRYGLEKPLCELSIPDEHVRPHAAGNDAFLALEGLLMLAARDISAMSHACMLEDSKFEPQGSIATTLEIIARTPYPLSTKSTKALAEEKPSKVSNGARQRRRTEQKALRHSNGKSTSTGELSQTTATSVYISEERRCLPCFHPVCLEKYHHQGREGRQDKIWTAARLDGAFRNATSLRVTARSRTRLSAVGDRTFLIILNIATPRHLGLKAQQSRKSFDIRAVLAQYGRKRL